MTQPHTNITASPLALGRLTLRNRLVSAPMERNYCDTEGHMTDVYEDYLVQRAAAGVALVMAEATYVRADGKGRTHQLGAHDDSCIPGLRHLADAMHAEGALVGCELNHGGRTAQSTVSGHPNVAPSPVPCAVAGGEMPRELTTAEIYELAAEYGTAAARCVAAGIDVLSIHGGHGYLVHQFMSPLYNHRSDEFADSALFLNLVIAAVRENAPNTPLGIRISVLEGTEGGLTAEQTLAIVARADLAALDFLDLSAGSYEAGEWIVQSGEWQPGLLSEYAAAYRRFGKPLGMAGRLNSPEIIETVLAEGTADFVSLARALHADPTFATACLEGGEYRPCIACNVCIDNLGVGPVGCTVNPTVGRGRVPLATPTVRTGSSVVVAGAGPAGLTLARELALAGADVTLADERAALGGQMAEAARMKSTPDFHRFLDWSAREFERLNVTVSLGTHVDESLLTALKPDAVVLATGGIRPQAPALSETVVAGESPVMDVRNWLETHELDEPLAACTIWGADGVAMSVADTLAARGTAVLLVGEQEQLAPDSGRRAKILALPRLMANPNVRILLGSTIAEIAERRIRITDADGTDAWLDAPGPLLISHGTVPAESEGELAAGLGIRHAVLAAGSAIEKSPATIRNAILSGYDTAQQLAAALH
ncbi:oxidoreductase [Leifsonia sp. Root112D2]|uniref:oxidoreductase n=1 Tax=Leifsonia sp. Root112D2 TaxID=1736426 RepID=UPI0007020C15|nr:FAD-dependent oxidoreductase [Leifsonia sp. Root112D2]KQV06792.1 NADH:flavin oxidoreductase [Leifsonia sp. Root112D2]